MQRTYVSSSNIRSVGYDSTCHILEVEFDNGSVYQYSGVPEAVHRALMSASSHGTYFDDHVKRADYSYRRIT